MAEWNELKTVKRGKFTIVYDYVYDEYDRPNDVYGIWEPVDKHEGGVTVQLPNTERGDHKWWKSCNYTPGQLAKEYAKDPDRILRALAGEKLPCPSKEAYKKLQDELQHYLRGDMYTARVRVLCGDEELHSDTIGFDYSDYMGPRQTIESVAQTMCDEHFGDPKALVADARAAATKRAKELRAQAKKLESAGKVKRAAKKKKGDAQCAA